MKRSCTILISTMVQQWARVKLVKTNVWRPALWLQSTQLIQEECRLFLDKSRETRRFVYFFFKRIKKNCVVIY